MSMNQLFAGAGSAPIHFPKELFPVEGFRDIHDDPSVKVLLLNCGERAAIVSIEIVMLSPEKLEEVRKTISEITGTDYDKIWVHVTHVITTPHEPHAPRGMGGVALELSEEEKKALAQKQALYNGAILEAVTAAAQEAVRTYRSAKMGIGTGECRVNVNRDVATPHGWWINFAPEGPSNHTATILRFDDENGKAIAAMISYSLKPCAIDNSEMDVNNRLISSDVPGLACNILGEQIGAPCLFFMSAAGDQVPVEQAWYDVVDEDGSVRKVDLGVQAGLEMVDRLGRRMADDLYPVLKAIVCDQEEPVIRLDQGCIEWAGKGRGKMKPTKTAEYIPQGTHRIDAAAMVLGDVALVGVKPETNAVTEAQLHAASPFKHTLLISMVNGGFKYMPDIASYENSTWEAQSAGLMPGAAEAWVEEAKTVLNRLYQNH